MSLKYLTYIVVTLTGTIMNRTLRIGLVQLEATRDKKKNIEKALKIIQQYNRVEADVIVFPEYFMFKLEDVSPEVLYSVSEDIHGEFVDNYIRIAREYSTTVVGTLFEKTSIKPKVYNTVVLVEPSGNVKIVYRKTHLFDAYGYKESNYMLPGDNLSTIETIKDVKVAFTVCFDIRFPEIYRIYALKGAEVIISPSAWYRGPLKEETLRFLAQSRAHENTMYIVIVNQTGKTFTGRSMIVDPMGTVVLDLGSREIYYEYLIDVDYIYDVRRKLPVLKLRRPKLYKDIVESLSEGPHNH